MITKNTTIFHSSILTIFIIFSQSKSIKKSIKKVDKSIPNRSKMKAVLLMIFAIAAMAEEPAERTIHKKIFPHKMRDEKNGFANPAVTFCQKLGLKTQTLHTKQGEIPACETIDGKLVDAWKLFRQLRLKQGEMTLHLISVDEAGNLVKGEAVKVEDLKLTAGEKTIEQALDEMQKEREERRRLRETEREERQKEREERRKLREDEKNEMKNLRRKEWEERRKKIDKEREERRKVREEKLGQNE